MNKNLENNLVTISGEISTKLEFSHEVFGEKFYMFFVDIPRNSGYVDSLPVIVSERLINVTEELRGLKVIVNGQYRSYNKHEEKKNYLMLSVFALEIEFVEEILNCHDRNSIYLEAVIVKEPIYRKTPYGREITDILVAVNRPYGKADYIPCICWGRNAKYVSNLNIGDSLFINGRIQSREYNKKLPDGTAETRIAYEVSVSVLEVKEDV